MGKYTPKAVSPFSFPPGPKVCDPGKATAWDVVDMTCYTIWGLAIVIGDKTAPVQGLYETFNLNMHCDGTQCPCVNQYQLPGTVEVKTT